MNPDENPPAIERIREQLACPRCRSTRAQGQVLVTVLANPPLYQVAGRCLRCGHHGFGLVITLSPEAMAEREPAQPVREQIGEDVPLADWVQQLHLGEPS